MLLDVRLLIESWGIQTLEKNRSQQCLKLGGLNTMLIMERSPAMPLVMQVPTIIVGIDVSHGSPGQAITCCGCEPHTMDTHIKILGMCAYSIAESGND